MKKNLFDNFSSNALEADKMKKITGGLSSGTSQLNTLTVTPSTSKDDGADDLLSGEHQD